jgi:hypothetical protein
MRRQKPVVFCVSVSDLSAHSVCVCVHTQYRTQYRRVCTRAQVKLNVDNHNKINIYSFIFTVRVHKYT